MKLTTEVLREEGVSYWCFVALMRARKMPPPQKNSAGDYCWSEVDVRNLRAALKKNRRGKYPRKEVVA